MRFAGKAVVITGAAGGIGTALTERFLREGASVDAADIGEAGLIALRDRVGDPAALRTHVFDVASEAACVEFASRVGQARGHVDVLVNNAGYFPVSPFETMTLAEWRHVCAVNLDSVFLLAREMLPWLKRGEAGRIVNIGSASVFKGNAGQCHYVAAKAGVIGLTRSLAQALGQYGITVNVVAPGLTATATAMETFSPEAMAERAQARPIKRVQVAADVVGAVTFLASADAAFVTGQTYCVDGGTNMR